MLAFSPLQTAVPVSGTCAMNRLGRHSSATKLSGCHIHLQFWFAQLVLRPVVRVARHHGAGCRCR